MTRRRYLRAVIGGEGDNERLRGVPGERLRRRWIIWRPTAK